MDHDLTREIEFRFSHDGTYVAVAICQVSDKVKPEVCVIRVSDRKRFDLANVSYDYGGCRLDVDPESRTLFTGAYYGTGIAAYNFESDAVVWERRDLKQLQVVAYDAFDDGLYCLCERRNFLLRATTGKERTISRGIEAAFFGRDKNLAVFGSTQVKLQNRETKTEHILPKATGNILGVAFTGSAAVLTWMGGPVTSHDLEGGKLLWSFKPAGTHAYAIATASDNESVWLAEQPDFEAPPWHRIRLLSSTGKIKEELRCDLGLSFEIVPYGDSIIRGNLLVTPIEELESS